jgi:MFS family permease
MPGSESDVPGSRVGGLRAIPRGVWALGVVSLFMDLSSEMIHSLLPVFLVAVLGASVLSVGVIEGVAEATASITKVFSGTLSDYLGRRKFLTGLGYALAAVTKPVFPLATSLSWVLAARFVDRIGKGIREAPRDALMGDLAPAAMRGACYGLRQSLDTVGAVAGPLVAAALMAVTLHDFRLVFWIAVIPAVLAVGILLVAVKEPPVRQPAPGAGPSIRVAEVRALQPVYWSVVVVGTILTLARFSEAFLLLRAADRGVSVALVPMVFVIMNIAYAVLAYPAGLLSDRLDRRLVLAAGSLVLIAGDIALALAVRPLGVFVGVALWGLHMGLTQGLLAALVTDTAPERLRGTAFGLFNLAGGLAALLASVVAGWLGIRYGMAAPFYAGAGFAGTALVGLLALHVWLPQPAAAAPRERRSPTSPRPG